MLSCSQFQRRRRGACRVERKHQANARWRLEKRRDHRQQVSQDAFLEVRPALTGSSACRVDLNASRLEMIRFNSIFCFAALEEYYGGRVAAWMRAICSAPAAEHLIHRH
ncbi:hypothetical protein F441_16086 [Phytophthora nicotianae CJ01A1]|uniref:Uncharacterized protein n=6 Tax=Phytophthora nicotianae TaxID=4792 RepID=W2PSS1_PHYN3|nr:hypothetical protein PPTG_23811 [Phytophthora nicotianae INRA-310]ETI37886.1 hypothetical protein F443_16259 [Phytophthora nicotianae P1569]ETK78070.1 hypothetical protein L915_15811 [Phytophthora nicotianae]ETO66632.1 hypothetical protein F444_16257 [Phytophthora nicotianae P1976]ETP07750.1 hypothetical protein F441_16086 [Phytophthora nicotianae CJ01A1]ETP35781.1 hypothetical protein F442_16116 [Phytophthora nicotianae P10297]